MHYTMASSLGEYATERPVRGGMRLCVILL